MARIIWRSSPGVFIWCLSRKRKLALHLHIDRPLHGVRHDAYPKHWPWWKRFALHYCRPCGPRGTVPGMWRMWIYRRGTWGRNVDFIIDRRGIV